MNVKPPGISERTKAVREFAPGWSEYECRWQTNQCPPRHFDKPRWNGEPLAGRTILLYAEQGLGDVVQFIRFAARARERTRRIVLFLDEYWKPLGPLLTVPLSALKVPSPGTFGHAGSFAMESTLPSMR